MNYGLQLPAKRDFNGAIVDRPSTVFAASILIDDLKSIAQRVLPQRAPVCGLQGLSGKSLSQLGVKAPVIGSISANDRIPGATFVQAGEKPTFAKSLQATLPQQTTPHLTSSADVIATRVRESGASYASKLRSLEAEVEHLTAQLGSANLGGSRMGAAATASAGALAPAASQPRPPLASALGAPGSSGARPVAPVVPVRHLHEAIVRPSASMTVPRMSYAESLRAESGLGALASRTGGGAPSLARPAASSSAPHFDWLRLPGPLPVPTQAVPSLPLPSAGPRIAVSASRPEPAMAPFVSQVIATTTAASLAPAPLLPAPVTVSAPRFALDSHVSSLVSSMQAAQRASEGRTAAAVATAAAQAQAEAAAAGGAAAAAPGGRLTGIAAAEAIYRAMCAEVRAGRAKPLSREEALRVDEVSTMTETGAKLARGIL